MSLDVTYRVQIPHRAGQLAAVASMIAHHDGLIGDVVTVNLGRDATIREITVEVRDTSHAWDLASDLNTLPGAPKPYEMVGLDCAIIMHPQVWKCSGHYDLFHDFMVDCRESKKRYRHDQVRGRWVEAKGQTIFVATQLGGDEGLAVVGRAIAGAHDWLNPYGRILLEIGAGQGPRAAEIAAEAGLAEFVVHTGPEGGELFLEAARELREKRPT